MLEFSFRCEAACSLWQRRLLYTSLGTVVKLSAAQAQKPALCRTGGEKPEVVLRVSESPTAHFQTLLVNVRPLKKLLSGRRGTEVKIVLCGGGIRLSRGISCPWVCKQLLIFVMFKSKESALFTHLHCEMDRSWIYSYSHHGQESRNLWESCSTGVIEMTTPAMGGQGKKGRLRDGDRGIWWVSQLVLHSGVLGVGARWGHVFPTALGGMRKGRVRRKGGRKGSALVYLVPSPSVSLFILSSFWFLLFPASLSLYLYSEHLVCILPPPGIFLRCFWLLSSSAECSRKFWGNSGSICRAGTQVWPLCVSPLVTPWEWVMCVQSWSRRVRIGWWSAGGAGITPIAATAWCQCTVRHGFPHVPAAVGACVSCLPCGMAVSACASWCSKGSPVSSHPAQSGRSLV